MSENTNTILCKCIICLENNVNGIFVSISTYNRHRNKQQKFSEKDDIKVISESHQNKNLEDIYQQEDMNQQEGIYDMDIHDIYQQENINQQEGIHDMNIHYIYQQEENLNLTEDSDIESFIINESDNENYSDYNKNIDDDEENIDDNDENIDNDNDDNYDEEEEGEEDTNIMQIDDEINKEIIEGLRLLHLKSLYNFTESAYEDIMKIFTTNNMSLYKVKIYLKNVTELVPTFYDMCENSCICYTGDYESCQICPICTSTRLDAKEKLRKLCLIFQ